jgi:N-acetylneuraminate synthase
LEIVAELSCNHSGSLQRAKDLITAAFDSGADAVKLQCWDRDDMVVDQLRAVPGGPWAGRNMADLYRDAWTPWEWFVPLFEHAAQLGIDIFSSVFDHSALTFLESINCPRYKIASFEALDRPLVNAVVATGKPVIISTGLLSMANVFDLAMRHSDVCQLLCVSEYPADPASYNLGRLRQLHDVWHIRAGVSDHTLGSAIPVAAAALGADVLEKHFQLPGDYTLDSAFSLTPKEFTAMVRDCRDVGAALGTDYPVPSENALSLRRSLWVARPLAAGDEITPGSVVSARPAGGLYPDAISFVIGNRVVRALSPGDPLCADDLEN